MVTTRGRIALACPLVLMVAAIAACTPNHDIVLPARSTAVTASAPPAIVSTTSPAPVETPPSSAVAAVSSLTIGWTGDTVPASSDFGLPADPGVFFGSITNVLSAPDLMMGNFEGTLTTRGTTKCTPPATPTPSPGATPSPSTSPEPTDCYAFRSPPSYARLFADAGFDLLSIANNHSYDFGAVGLSDTTDAIEQAGLPYTGLASQITVVHANGIDVAVVGFASYSWTGPLNDSREAARLVAEAKTKAPVVVVIFHGGAEGADAQHVPEGTEYAFGENRGDLRHFALTVIDAGADLVLGDGPHLLRGMEFYNGKLISYSAGNLVGYRVLSGVGNLSAGMVLTVRLTASGGFLGATINPMTMSTDGAARPDPNRRAIGLITSLTASDFPVTGAHIDDDGNVTAP
jgi:hypothetical protein